MRRRRTGWPQRPSIGYKSPEHLRYLHPCALIEKIVNNEKEMDELDPKKHAVRIAHSVGEKKRLAILDRAQALELRVLNPPSVRAPEPSEPEPDQIGKPEPSESSTADNVEENREKVTEK